MMLVTNTELPALPPTRPPEVWNTAATVRALGDRDPTKFSDPSIQLFHATMKAVDIQLQKSHLLAIEHIAIQEKIRADQKRKVTSRRSVYKGGPSERVEDLRELFVFEMKTRRKNHSER